MDPASLIWYPDIDIGFHLGVCVFANSNKSITKRIDGSGGKIYVPRAIYSFNISFCIVPISFLDETP